MLHAMGHAEPEVAARRTQGLADEAAALRPPTITQRMIRSTAMSCAILFSKPCCAWFEKGRSLGSAHTVSGTSVRPRA